MSDLDSVINGTVSDEVANPVISEEVAAELKAEPTVEEESTPTVEKAEEDQGEVEVKAESESDKVDNAFKAKALDETQKRQGLEGELKTLREQIAKTANPVEKPDFWSNPDAAIDGIGETVDQKIAKATTNMSVTLMRSLHDDYDDKETVFIDLIGTNPALVAQMNQSDNPAKFAYDYATSHLEMKQIQDAGNMETFKADLIAQGYAAAKAELEGETNTKIAEAIETRSKLPGSLSNERASGGNANAAYQKPSLESIVG